MRYLTSLFLAKSIQAALKNAWLFMDNTISPPRLHELSNLKNLLPRYIPLIASKPDEEAI